MCGQIQKSCVRCETSESDTESRHHTFQEKIRWFIVVSTTCYLWCVVKLMDIMTYPSWCTYICTCLMSRAEPHGSISGARDWLRSFSICVIPAFSSACLWARRAAAARARCTTSFVAMTPHDDTTGNPFWLRTRIPRTESDMATIPTCHPKCCPIYNVAIFCNIVIFLAHCTNFLNCHPKNSQMPVVKKVDFWVKGVHAIQRGFTPFKGGSRKFHAGFTLPLPIRKNRRNCNKYCSNWQLLNWATPFCCWA